MISNEYTIWKYTWSAIIWANKKFLNPNHILPYYGQTDSKTAIVYYEAVQLNEYETAPYSIQLSQKLTSDCLLISVFLSVFAWFAHKIVLQIKLKQFYEHIMQELVKKGKYTKVKKQSYVKFWLNWIQFGAVSYSLSCKSSVA